MIRMQAHRNVFSRFGGGDDERCRADLAQVERADVRTVAAQNRGHRRLLAMGWMFQIFPIPIGDIVERDANGISRQL